jgi:YVTN family beta-propeller protein
MRLVQSKAAVALVRPGRPQKRCGIKKLAFALSLLACLFAPAAARAQNAYITNSGDGTVSVIDTATNTVVGSPITVGTAPFGVAVTSDGSKVYVTNQGSNNVSVIATATNTVVGSPIPVGNAPIAFGKFIQPFIAFSAFAPDLTVYPVQSEFSIKASFTLGATSNAINPPTEQVTLQIGSFTTTIPIGSFVNVPGVPGYFTFVGVVDGVSLNVLIRQTSGNNYILGVIAKSISLTIPNPPATVPVTLTIGGDKGTTTVTPAIINTK